MINFSFFSVKIIKSINLYFLIQLKKIFYYSIMYSSCTMLYISNSIIWILIRFKHFLTWFLGFGDTLPLEPSCHFWPHPYLCWDARLTQFQRRIKNPRLWMILSWTIDMADRESIVTLRILPDSSYYTDKMLSVYTIRTEQIITDFLHV